MPDDSDYRAFVALVDAHGATLLALLRRLCRNEHDAEDLFQETAARVWRNFAARPVLRNPRGWLMRIGYHVFLDHRQSRKPPEAFTESPDTRLPTPPEDAQQKEDACRVQAAVSDLPRETRDVIVLHYTGGLSIQETAEAMAIAQGTVKSRLNAALNQLRRRLQ